MFFIKKNLELPSKEECLPGREAAIQTATEHFVFKRPLKNNIPDGFEQVMFGMGCFWGAERKFWQIDGVYLTAVGYAAGHTPNPTYEEVCSGRTAHNEVVHVVFDPSKVAFKTLLKVFWESHDPTQKMRQGNDMGTQYRSGIYTYSDAHFALAKASRDQYSKALEEKSFGSIATEILAAGPFFYAEDYHQQYLAKKPDGYCGLGGTGVSCPS